MILTTLLMMQGPVLAPEGTGEGALTLPNPFGPSSELQIFGRFQQDFAWIDDDNFGTPDGSEARRARIGVGGNLAEGLDFKMEVDFASFDGSGAAFTDAYLKFGGLPLGTVQVGHFKEPFSLNELTSSRFLTFTERADTFAIGRNTGVMISDATEEMTWQAGGFWDTAKNLDTSGNSTAATGRFVFRPTYADDGASLVHVGGAVSIRENDGGMYSQSSSGGIHLLGGDLVAATIAADDLTLIGLEAAWQEGPAHAELEYVMADGDDDSFSTWYVQGGYFLTGESRGYKTSSAAFSRVNPLTPWGGSGNGAWEVAGRINGIDLSEGAADQEATQVALGLNWYMTSHARIMFSLYQGDSDALSDDVMGAVIRFAFDF
jgi:phosphate-selective porin OprO and OprP